MPYGNRWRRWRKVCFFVSKFSNVANRHLQVQYMGLNAKVALTYNHFQMLESSVLLKDLMARGWRDGEDITRSWFSHPVLNAFISFPFAGSQHPWSAPLSMAGA
jgi:hypothetical protein